jgi:hypothetical protein
MIGLVVALPAEAEPLVRHYRLERCDDAFRWYRGDDFALVVSGVGKTAAAAATAYLHGRTGEAPFGVWLNVGIAGHRTRPSGDLLVAHTVCDASSGERWYPARLGGPSLDPVEVRTVDRPETAFDSDAAYEMEASGMFPVALRWSTAELVHAIKVVSDNLSTGLTALTARAVAELVESRLDSIAAMAEHCHELASELGPLRSRRVEALVEEYRKCWPFTVTEARRLKRLLLRWEALDPEGDHGPASATFEGAVRGSETLLRLASRLQSIATERPL